MPRRLRSDLGPASTGLLLRNLNQTTISLGVRGIVLKMVSRRLKSDLLGVSYWGSGKEKENLLFSAWGLGFGVYLEGQGHLVRRLITPISHKQSPFSK